MTAENVTPIESECKSRTLRTTHYGVVRIGDISIECAVLEDGRSGFIQRQLMQAIGFTEKSRSGRFRRLLAEIAPKTLIELDKSQWPVSISLPQGGRANLIPCGILTGLVSDVVDAALEGRLHPQRAGLVAPCQMILKALAKVGEEALIHEATGYQYVREPNALQDLFTRLIRQAAADWERRFHPEYYSAVCKLFGIRYGGHHRALPSVIGMVTLRWVYEAVFPPAIVQEIKSRRRSEKLHQWLTAENGLRLLESQVEMITTLAATSVDYKDFEARCIARWPQPGQQLAMIYPTQAVGTA